jgi:ATP-dependent protease ClpP protease subunit
LLNKVTNKDTVIFKINTNGGLVQTTLAIINAIKSCNAMTVAEIQAAYSAGGIIAMACKKQIVMPYATMMIHSIQLGASGDLNMIQEELKCFKKLNDDIITNSFKNFLTKKELEYVLKGGVIWLNDEEIRNRLKK